MKKNFKKAFSAIMTAAMLMSNISPYVTTVSAATTGWSQNHEAYFYDDNGTVKQAEIKKSNETKATCSKEAYVTVSAYDADGKLLDSVDVKTGDKLAHTNGETKTTYTVNTTCTTDGKYNSVVLCKVCGEEIAETLKKDQVEKATGHKAGNPEVVETVKATCTADGYTVEVTECTVCGAELAKETKVNAKDPATGHKWTVTTGTEPTCTEPGIGNATCANGCGEKLENQEIPALGHKYVAFEEQKAATCTEAGSYTKGERCSVCGDEKDVVTTPGKEANGHKYEVKKVVKEATCAAEGLADVECSVCGDKTQQAIEKTDHVYGEEKEVAGTKVEPTCTEWGSVSVVEICAICKEPMNGPWEEDLPPVDHKFVAEKVLTEATCTEEGYAFGTCSVCGLKDYYDIPATEKHVELAEAKEDIVEATCEEAGSYNLVVRCAVGGEIIKSTPVTVEATGHDYVADAKKTKAATCTKDGYKYDVCTVCKKVEEGVVPSSEHEAVLKDVPGAGYAETCSKAGSKYQKCDVCGETIISEIPAHEAKPAEKAEKNIIPATCTKDGEEQEVIKCTLCGETYEIKSSTPIPAEHKYVVTKVNKQYTCTEDGEEAIKCSVCGDTTTRVVPAHHELDEMVVIEPTCENDGSSYVACKKCDYKETGVVTEKTEALGHNYDVVKGEVFWSEEKDEAAGYVVYTSKCPNKNCENPEVKEIKTFDKADKCVSVEEVKATCEAVGKLIYTYAETLENGLVVKSAEAKTIETQATGHDFQRTKENVVEATCTKDGSYDSVSICTTCGKEEEKSRTSVTVEKLGHEYDEKEETKVVTLVEGTDTTPAKVVEVRKCSRCGEDVEQGKPYEIPAKGHTPGALVEVERKDATCFDDGYVVRAIYCADHPDVEIYRYKETLYAEHDFEYFDEYKPSTCTELGYKYKGVKCTKCGLVDWEEKWEETRYGEHTALYTKTVATKAATCTEAGEQADVTYCGMCFEEIKRGNVTEIPALGHQETTTTENEVAGSCTEAGSCEKVTSCVVCGEELARETIEGTVVGHVAAKEVIENLKEATNTTNRTYDKVVRCENCDKVLSKETVVVEKEVNKKLKICNCMNKKLKASKVKKAAKTYNIHTYVNGEPKLTFKKVSGSSKITVSANGKLTVKKGTKKGTYKVTVKVTSAETPIYKKTSATKVITITVK